MSAPLDPKSHLSLLMQSWQQLNDGLVGKHDDTLRKVSAHLKQFINARWDVTPEVPPVDIQQDLKLKLLTLHSLTTNNTGGGKNLLGAVARIHGIDIRDIKDIESLSTTIVANEIKSICRKLDKPLQKERNTLLPWPIKQPKKKKTEVHASIDDNAASLPFEDIPLYNIN